MGNRFERALFVAGAVCLGWYGGVRAAASHEQTRLSHELEIARAPIAAVAPLAPRSLVGRIELPRLKLSAVAREGVDDRTLDIAVGHVPGTSLPGTNGNAAFAAHRDTFFRPLRGVHNGDEVVVTTPGGGTVSRDLDARRGSGRCVRARPDRTAHAHAGHVLSIQFHWQRAVPVRRPGCTAAAIDISR
jgi:hypothetical protein